MASFRFSSSHQRCACSYIASSLLLALSSLPRDRYDQLLHICRRRYKHYKHLQSCTQGGDRRSLRREHSLRACQDLRSEEVRLAPLRDLSCYPAEAQEARFRTPSLTYALPSRQKSPIRQNPCAHGLARATGYGQSQGSHNLHAILSRRRRCRSCRKNESAAARHRASIGSLQPFFRATQ